MRRRGLYFHPIAAVGMKRGVVRPDSDDLSTLCRWHPSRRAVGFCEACERELCQPCVLDGHPCGGPDSDPPAGGGGRRLALAQRRVP